MEKNTTLGKFPLEQLEEAGKFAEKMRKNIMVNMLERVNTSPFKALNQRVYKYVYKGKAFRSV